MPVFYDIETNENGDLEFEVYCGTCGAGLCLMSDTRSSRRRNYPQVTVEACPTCMGNKDDEINSLKDEIKNLEEELSKSDDIIWDLQQKVDLHN